MKTIHDLKVGDGFEVRRDADVQNIIYGQSATRRCTLHITEYTEGIVVKKNSKTTVVIIEQCVDLPDGELYVSLTPNEWNIEQGANGLVEFTGRLFQKVTIHHSNALFVAKRTFN